MLVCDHNSNALRQNVLEADLQEPLEGKCLHARSRVPTLIYAQGVMLTACMTEYLESSL